MKLHFLNLADDLMSAVTELQDVAGFTLADDGTPVTVEQGGEGLSVTYTTDGITLRYSQRVELFRAVSRLVDTFNSREDVQEIPAYEDLCVMYDVARNAVMTVDTFKKCVRHLALMGYNSVQLYAEDVFEIDGYPYFGYLRGKYTKAEMKEMAAYGDKFGVELTPCIQVLAHLWNVTRWAAFGKVKDYDDILLIDEPETYNLIEAMFKSLAECFTSRRVNIGFDEAWMVGYGRYKQQHGLVDRVELLGRHMKKVNDICQKYGFTPMMWSDMHISTAFGHDYYYPAEQMTDAHMPQNVIDSVPENMELIYWDYGNFYQITSEMCRIHNEFRNSVWFAGGATKWAGYVPMNLFSQWVSRDQLRACRDNGIRKVMVTVWGSNGSECAFMSVLNTLVLFAEDCYADRNDDAWCTFRFPTCTGGASYDDFQLLDYPNFTPGNKAPGCGSRNPSKYLLHQDVLVGLFDKHLDAETFPPYFAETAVKLREAAARNPAFAYLFEMEAALCEVLELKAALGVNLTAAYKAGDKATMADIADRIIPETLARLEKLIYTYRNYWLTESKPIGLEIIEVRFGGLERRIKTAADRVHDYLAGRVDSLPELEEERLFYDGHDEEGRNLHTSVDKWHPIISACPIDRI
ncbi:MAG: beta-N-acetylhexosaminidase [Clostridia bacterium]|nr:beta-N-acetylhexosaminidase [Clostridia bacterium]